MKLIQLRTVHILSPVAAFSPSTIWTVPRIGSPRILKVAYPIYSYTMWGSLAKLVNITPITLITMVYDIYSIL